MTDRFAAVIAAMLQPSRTPNRLSLLLPPYPFPPSNGAIASSTPSSATEGHHLPDLTILGRHLKPPCKTHAVLVLSTNGALPPTPQRSTRLIFTPAEEFEEYAEKAKTLPDTTTNESKLCLYSLYKQAIVGPVNTFNTKSTSLIFRYSTLTEYLLQSAEEQNCSNQQQHSTVTWISGRGESAARAK
ncbi:hypothetical protein ZWY2020_002001 [Hordeum vulgare]|nr:hypothetical protein ZWY2020_002001 [Hordeum vulgare]